MKELDKQLKRNNRKIKKINKRISYYVGLKTFFLEENKRIACLMEDLYK